MLRQQALAALLVSDPHAKADRVAAIDVRAPVDALAQIPEPPGIPGRAAAPALVPFNQLKRRSMATPGGRAALIHALAHIEANAVNLALDIVWRFAGMPDDFYRDWLRVAVEEAHHFRLLSDHLASLGHQYGDFAAHDALWEMADKTRHDLLARVALVPRTLETRGLDASPPIKAKLVQAGDHRAGQILDIILRDEIGHVALGNRWYRWLCGQRGLDPVATYSHLAQRHGAPRLRAPFNIEARRAAGFTDEELRLITDAAGPASA